MCASTGTTAPLGDRVQPLAGQSPDSEHEQPRP
jgi:hypothetical protein